MKHDSTNRFVAESLRPKAWSRRSLEGGPMRTASHRLVWPGAAGGWLRPRVAPVQRIPFLRSGPNRRGRAAVLADEYIGRLACGPRR